MYALKRKALEFVRCESGPTATEYAVLIMLIAIGVLVAFSGIGDRMNGIYLAISGAMGRFL